MRMLSFLPGSGRMTGFVEAVIGVIVDGGVNILEGSVRISAGLVIGNQTLCLSCIIQELRGSTVEVEGGVRLGVNVVFDSLALSRIVSNPALELRLTLGVRCGVLAGRDCPAIVPHQSFHT